MAEVGTATAILVFAGAAQRSRHSAAAFCAGPWAENVRLRRRHDPERADAARRCSRHPGGSLRLTRFLRESTVARMSTIDTGGSPATSSQDALFTFSASPGFTTECSLDGAAFRRCSSPRTYHGLAAGLHTFCIRAVQGALQESVPDCRTWRIAGDLELDSRLACAVAAPAWPLRPGAATAGCCGCGAGRSPGRSDP